MLILKYCCEVIEVLAPGADLGFGVYEAAILERIAEEFSSGRGVV